MKVGSWVWMAMTALLFLTLLGGHAVVSGVMPFALLQFVIFGLVLLAGGRMGREPLLRQTGDQPRWFGAAGPHGEMDAAGNLPDARATLREIEAELHALQDQFNTELRVAGTPDHRAR